MSGSLRKSHCFVGAMISSPFQGCPYPVISGKTRVSCRTRRLNDRAGEFYRQTWGHCASDVEATTAPKRSPHLRFHAEAPAHKDARREALAFGLRDCLYLSISIYLLSLNLSLPSLRNGDLDLNSGGE